MEKHTIHYDTFIRVTRAISESKDPEEVVLITTESVKSALNVKGCSIFLVNKKTKELELAASFGLSDKYLKKGPLNFTMTDEEDGNLIYHVAKEYVNQLNKELNEVYQELEDRQLIGS